MGGSYLGQAGVFLIEVLFGLYILALMLRFLLAMVRADFHNQLSQFIVKVTNPPLIPLRRFIPAFMGIDWANIILIFALQSVAIMLTMMIVVGGIAAPAGLLVITLAEILKTLIYLYLFIILIQVVISWVNPSIYNPMTVMMHQLTEPLMRSVRRIIPPAGGFDWSALIVIILLQLGLILIVTPIADIGRRISIG